MKTTALWWNEFGIDSVDIRTFILPLAQYRCGLGRVPYLLWVAVFSLVKRVDCSLAPLVQARRVWDSQHSRAVPFEVRGCHPVVEMDSVVNRLREAEDQATQLSRWVFIIYRKISPGTRDPIQGGSALLLA